ncbi:hypothetical protein PQR37_18690 [Paraburkholderia nemoris]|uniref:hypothetical protein n=1 Tax=Paraburkholderia nemoris TaxID=2793076 RepID=UPI0038BBC5BD
MTLDSIGPTLLRVTVKLETAESTDWVPSEDERLKKELVECEARLQERIASLTEVEWTVHFGIWPFDMLERNPYLANGGAVTLGGSVPDASNPPEFPQEVVRSW